MKILDIALKDLRHSSRNRFALGMTLLAPLLITGLLYLAFGGARKDPPSLSVGIVQLDLLPPTSPLEAPIGASVRDMFHDASVASWIRASDFASEDGARRAIEERRIGMAVVIPRSFTSSLLGSSPRAGEDSRILLISDPTLQVGPALARSMLASLIDGVRGGGIALETWSRLETERGLSLDRSLVLSFIERYAAWYRDFQRALYHDPQRAALGVNAPSPAGGRDAMASILALVMAGQLVFFAFYTGAWSMLGVVKEEEAGTLARLFSSPTGRGSILAGKCLAVLLALIAQGLVLLILGRLLFGIDWGRPGSTALAFLAQVLAAGGLGVLIIALVRTSRQAGPVLGGVLTGLGILGGLFTVGVSMPLAFERMSLCTPQAWVLKGWRLALSGAAPSELLLPCLVSALMGILCFTLGAALFRRRFSQRRTR